MRALLATLLLVPSVTLADPAPSTGLVADLSSSPMPVLDGVRLFNDTEVFRLAPSDVRVELRFVAGAPASDPSMEVRAEVGLTSHLQLSLAEDITDTSGSVQPSATPIALRYSLGAREGDVIGNPAVELEVTPRPNAPARAGIRLLAATELVPHLVVAASGYLEQNVTLQTLVSGLTNDVPSSLKSMNVGGTSMTMAQVLAQAQAYLMLFTNVVAAKQAWAAAVAAKKAALASAHAFFANVEVNLKQAFGTNQAELALFGIKPPKTKAKPTTTTKAIAAAKRAATRAARGTKGSKQKAAITTTPQPTLQVLAPDGTPLGATAPAAPAAPVAPEGHAVACLLDGHHARGARQQARRGAEPTPAAAHRHEVSPQVPPLPHAAEQRGDAVFGLAAQVRSGREVHPERVLHGSHLRRRRREAPQHLVGLVKHVGTRAEEPQRPGHRHVRHQRGAQVEVPVQPPTLFRLVASARLLACLYDHGGVADGRHNPVADREVALLERGAGCEGRDHQMLSGDALLQAGVSGRVGAAVERSAHHRDRAPSAGNGLAVGGGVHAGGEAGLPLVLVDNINVPLGCAALDSALTANLWVDRLLGENRMASVPLLMTWYATGNNVEFAAGDMRRRTLHIRLNSPLERPQERRDFSRDNLLDWVRAERHRLLAQAATLLRAYVVAGRPTAELTPWGSYESWSVLVRGVLRWLDMPDPYEATAELLETADPASRGLGALLKGWEKLDPQHQGLTAGDALKILKAEVEAETSRSGGGPMPHSDLRAALLEVCPGPGGSLPAPRQLSQYFRRIRGRIAPGNLAIDSRTVHGGFLGWHVRRGDWVTKSDLSELDLDTSSRTDSSGAGSAGKSLTVTQSPAPG